MLAVCSGEVGLPFRGGYGAVGKTDTDLGVVFITFVITVAIMLRLTQRPVDETGLDETIEVLGETIAVCDKLLQGQRREIKLVVTDDPATCVPSPSSRIRCFCGFSGNAFSLGAASFCLHDLLADTGCGLPCVLTITTVGLLVGQGESVASFTLRALWQL